MYATTTRNIKVEVNPFYLDEESDPTHDRFFWGYHVTIKNNGNEVVQLKMRHWRITDANGRTEEVVGEGVVGEQPVLGPGEEFEYTSGCPLTTQSGIMAGNYQMETTAGETFLIDIPAFSLDTPNLSRIVN